MSNANCPLCVELEESDNYSSKIADLSVSTLRLSKNQAYKGYCTLIFTKRHAIGLESLSQEEYFSYLEDLRKAAKAISVALNPALMNYASLGNVISHLHFHIIPRYENDPRWGKPIWTTSLDEMHEKNLSDADFHQLLKKIKQAL